MNFFYKQTKLKEGGWRARVSDFFLQRIQICFREGMGGGGGKSK